MIFGYSSKMVGMKRHDQNATCLRRTEEVPKVRTHSHCSVSVCNRKFHFSFLEKEFRNEEIITKSIELQLR